MSILWAERAIDYVRNVCQVLSNNRDWDTRTVVRDVSASRQEGLRRMLEVEGGWQSMLNAEVSAYRELQAGNCEEMAKIAFVYLAEHNIRPIELVYVRGNPDGYNIRQFGTTTNIEVEPDHAFVIIGREINITERNERNSGIISIPNYNTWNFGAVICDPWAKRCYLAHNLPMEMEMINRVTAGQTELSSDPRMESGEDWDP